MHFFLIHTITHYYLFNVSDPPMARSLPAEASIPSCMNVISSENSCVNLYNNSIKGPSRLYVHLGAVVQVALGWPGYRCAAWCAKNQLRIKATLVPWECILLN